MNRSVVLKQERKQKIDAQSALNQKLTDEKRTAFTEEEATQFRTLQTEVEALTEQIKMAEAHEENLRSLAQNGGGSSAMRSGGEEGELADMKKRYSLHRALDTHRRGRELDGVEREFHDETVKRAKTAGVAIAGIAVPMSSGEKRFAGQSVGEDSGVNGGALVATDQQPIIEALRPKPVLRDLGARYMTGLVGNLEFPVNDGGITASWAGEVAAATSSKNEYTTKGMQPKRLTAAVPISLQNLMQVSWDLEMFTIDEINAVMANALDLAGINGSGAGNVPLGILNASGTNSVTGGTDGAAPTWDHIVDLETKVFVENANAAKMAYLINAVTKGKLKRTKHEAGDLGYLMAMDNTINGYGVGVSNLVPADITKGTGTNLSAGIFGDFSQLLMGQWAFLDLTVDNVSKKREGYVDIVVNLFADVLVRQPKAFTVVKDWVTT